MREKGQTEVAKTLEIPVFSRGIEILTEKEKFIKNNSNIDFYSNSNYSSVLRSIFVFGQKS